ncbi:MAG: hypothetical protein ACI8PZ_007452 [Myxococcota bacterium]|jgi:hypothetical protein
MNPRIKLIATSHPDEDRMLVDILVDGEQLAVLIEGAEDHEFILYPRRDGMPWSLPKGLLLEAIEAATSRLDKLLPRRR